MPEEIVYPRILKNKSSNLNKSLNGSDIVKNPKIESTGPLLNSQIVSNHRSGDLSRGQYFFSEMTMTPLYTQLLQMK